MSGTTPAGPAADVEVDLALIHRLLDGQAPDVCHLPVRILTSGWDNVIARLGDDLVVRVPRRQLADQLIANEQCALTLLAAELPLPVPAPILLGRPTSYFPYAWSVVPWLDGAPALDRLPDPATAAGVLGRFVAALHRPGPADGPTNPYRGVALAQRWTDVDARITALRDRGTLTDDEARRTREILRDAVDTPPWPGPSVWVHGDLHPRNILVQEGRIAAVIDFGDVHVGDPAVDATVAWYLLPLVQHEAFRHRAPSMDDDTWRRGQGWMINHVTAVAVHAADDRRFARIALESLRRLLA